MVQKKKDNLKKRKRLPLRSPKVEEAEEMLEYLRTCAAKPFILFTEEVTLTVEQEEQYIKSRESESNLLLQHL